MFSRLCNWLPQFDKEKENPNKKEYFIVQIINKYGSHR